ncbi:MAG: peptide deformylase [bacterium]
MIRRICKYGEPVLRRKTKNVRYEKIRDRLPAILQDMWETCGAVNGLGLAANQIGLDLRLAVIEIRKDGVPPRRLVLINPEIKEKSGVVREEEGCLSFPGLFARIKRHEKVTIAFLNEKGFPSEVSGQGLFARALQHEIDHLDGKMFTDRLPMLTRLKLKKVLRKLAPGWAKIDESELAKRTGS